MTTYAEVTAYASLECPPDPEGSRCARTHDRPRARRVGGSPLTGLFVTASLFLSGCASNGTASSGWLPQGTNGGQVTNNTGRVTNLWVGTWIAALAVGLIVWGLTIWVMVAYRRKKTDVGLPPQLRYNVPIEMLYTIVPVFMVARALLLHRARRVGPARRLARSPT